jgi:GNAT superfamily N-acetyltransferase
MMRDFVLPRWKKRDKSVRIFLSRIHAPKKAEHKTIIGWSCIIVPHPNYCIPIKPNVKAGAVYVFVQWKHRRKGIGKRLIKNTISFAQERGLKPIVYGWDKLSLNFFDKCHKADSSLVVRDHSLLV